jgi:hypothetical protein
MPRTLEVLFFLRQTIPAGRRTRMHITLYNRGIGRYVSSNMPIMNRGVMHIRGLIGLFTKNFIINQSSFSKNKTFPFWFDIFVDIVLLFLIGYGHSN